MILCIGTTPAAQRVMLLPRLLVDAVNRATRTLDGAAGKSINVAKVLKTLGDQPLAMGFLGGDRGAEIRAALAAKEIESEFVPVSARTRQCVTVIDESTGTQTELVEESQPASADDYEQITAIIRRHLPGSRAVVLSGTITPGGPVDCYRRWLMLAHDAGALTAVDAQGAVLLEALKATPGLVKPNRRELAATLGRELKDDADVMSAMKDLYELGAQRVVVTAGKDPAPAFDGRNFSRIQTPRIAAVNPIGSGDAFTAALVWRLLRKEDLSEACRWGAAAGAANALTLMPGELNRDDVERLAHDVIVERL